MLLGRLLEHQLVILQKLHMAIGEDGMKPPSSFP
jgi:hypothetical protein